MSPRRKPLAPGKGLQVGVPLQRSAGLARGTGLSRSTPLPRCPLPCSPTSTTPRPTAKTRPAGRAPMPRWLAAYVLERAEGRCDRCGRLLEELGFSRQHRRAHGMGGRVGAELHTAANVVVLCGSATTPRGCHNLAENAERKLCEDEGWVIRGETIRPEEHPVLRHGRDLVIPTVAGWVPVQPPAGGETVS